MRACLINGCEVEIDPRCAEIGVWKRKPLRPRGQPTLEFFFSQLAHLEKPCALDIGAGVGNFSMLAKFHPDATFFAFEPFAKTRKLMFSNLERNHVDDRVTVWPYALTDKDGFAKLKVPTNAQPGLACLGDPLRFTEWQEVEVETRRLDSLALGKIDLIKIDTEGCELFVLMGGEETIRAHTPSILMEYCRTNTLQFGYKPKALIKLLQSWGYKEFTKVNRENLWITK